MTYLQKVDRTLIHQKSRALFLVVKPGFQAVMSATVHVRHVACTVACDLTCHLSCLFSCFFRADDVDHLDQHGKR